MHITVKQGSAESHTEMSYDAAGRLIKITEYGFAGGIPTGSAGPQPGIKPTRNACVNAQRHSDVNRGSMVTVTFKYDSFGRVTEESGPAGYKLRLQ